MDRGIRLFPLSIVCVVMTGCASKPSASEEMRFMSSIPRCTGEKDCEIKWAAARRWLLTELNVKLQHHGPDFMESVDPEEHGIGARVMKEPIDQNTYRILIDTWCEGLGCFLSQMQYKQSFNDYVNGAGGAPLVQSEAQ
jgi:hypothetical protein